MTFRLGGFTDQPLRKIVEWKEYSIVLNLLLLIQCEICVISCNNILLPLDLPYIEKKIPNK